MTEIDAFVIFLAVIGSLTIIKIIWSLLILLKQCLWTRSNLSKYYEKDSYAVVTGASDGIGKQFAMQLAKKGFNVILMARSKDKMDLIANDIKQMGVKALVYPIDFSSNAGFEKLEKDISKHRITILVNNVGVSHEMPTPFSLEDPDKIDQIVQVNISSVLKMTRLILPSMLEQKKGLILNMGSFSSVCPSPYLSVYGPTKGFLSLWSQALSHELSKTGVHVELLNTMYVVSAMSKLKTSSLFVPTAESFVQAVLKRAGNAYYHTPYYAHNIVTWLVKNLIPEAILVSMMMNQLIQIRKRAIKKRDRTQRAE